MHSDGKGKGIALPIALNENSTHYVKVAYNALDAFLNSVTFPAPVWRGSYSIRRARPYLVSVCFGRSIVSHTRYNNTTVKTAQRLYLLFRQAIYDVCVQQLTQIILDGEIEVDESMYGGHRKGKRGWGAAGKHIVFGMYQRNGFVFTFPVPDRNISTLIPLVQKHTHARSLSYSDDWHAYTRLSVKGDHVVIVKGKGVPRAKGRVHITGIEGFWSFSKKWLYRYRGIPQHHFPLYLKQTEYRFNYRDKDLFLEIAKQITQTRYQ